MEKNLIEMDSVEETLLIPLYGRWLCTKRFPGLFQDAGAGELMERLDYDFPLLEKRASSLMQSFGALEAAMRQSDMAWEIRDYLRLHPNAAVVNLGCGLDDTGRMCDNGRCRIWNLDLPNVIGLRNRLLPERERERNLAVNLLDFRWMEEVEMDPQAGVILFAAGVFYYFKAEEIKRLLVAMAERFPGGRLVFDAAGKIAVGLMRKTWVKQAGIQDLEVFFSIKNAKRELEAWSPRLSVSSRGYMLGYQELRGPGVKPVHRLLAKTADGPLGLQIVRVEFLQDG